MQANQKLRVGVAQVDTRLEDTKGNLDKHLAYVANGLREKLDLLVFPETSLSGYPHGEVFKYGLRYGGAEVRRIADAARGMAVAFGFIEEADAAQFYNTCVVVRDGDILHIHRKLNLATYGGLEEGKYFAAGRYVDAFDLTEEFWRLSVLVCADAWNPALVHLAALHGVTLLLVPTSSAEDVVSSEFSNPDGWDRATRFYGMIYGMPIVVANRVGKEAGLSFWGGSGIVDPYGNLVEQAPRHAEALICADIDYADVRRARVQLPTVRDSNLALVRREMARLESLIGVPAKVRKL